jgi:sugar phosphate isomerase/epimerase
VIVSASTYCFHQLPLKEALSRLVDLEYSAVEIAIHEQSGQLRPSQVRANLDEAIDICRDTHRLDIVAYDLQIDAQGETEAQRADDYYDQFSAACRLARATKVVTLVVPSAELGTPFNEEVEHLRRLVDLATLHGTRVSIKTQSGRLSEDPDTLVVLCDNVKGLGVTLDPSHFLSSSQRSRNVEKITKYVHHVHLRDSTKDKLQVRIGQGEIEYGRLISQLRRFDYDRALCVHVTEMPDVDHYGEMRKMRLLLESLL